MEEAIIDMVAKPIEALASMAFKESKFAVTKDLDSNIVWLGDCFCSITAKLQNLDPSQASTDIEKLQDMHDDLKRFFTKLGARARVQREVMGSRGFTAKVCSSLSSPKQFVLRFIYAQQVKDLTSKLKNLASANELCNKLSVDPSGNQDCRTSSEDTSPFPDTNVFIGRHTDKENIINLLYNYSVVAIVGVGGQGKTTLAQYVCQDDWVKVSFDLLLWVSITPHSSIKEICEKIIASATGFLPTGYNLEQLHKQLLQAIDKKKCLLVLDNVSYVSNLRADSIALNSILSLGNFWGNGGKVLITTRSKAVAKLMDDACKKYELHDLAENDCWILLLRYANKEKECDVAKIGLEIASRCPKIPLVLKTIGCYLADKDYERWEHFKDELASDPTLYIEQQEKTKQILKLCYDQLNCNLKHCVVYCSLFPKGHLYDKNYMVGKWIELGFVESRGTRSLQDVGDEYVLELTQRAFFEEAGTFEFFKMHDVMHDLMLLIGKYEHQSVDSNTKGIVDGVRHVSLNMQDLNWDVLLSSISGIQTLESILLVSPAWDNRVHGVPLRSGIEQLILACQKLKVLEIYQQQIQKVPKSIGELRLMTHLNLSGNDFCKLPKEITKMVNLLALDLSRCRNLQELPSKMGKLSNLLSLNLEWCWELKELPSDMRKLLKLRHLRVKWCELLKCMPEGFGKLTELETLDMFIIGQSSRSSRGLSKAKAGAKLEELGHLKNLKGDLCIKVAGESKNIVSDARKANLEKLTKLAKLEIICKNSAEEDEKFLEVIQLSGENWKELSIKNYGGKRLPLWMTDDQFHKRFPKLDLFSLCRTNMDPMPSISDYNEDECMRFAVKGKEDDLGEWVPRYSRIKEHLKMGTIELHFTTRRRDGLTLTDVREDVTLQDVCLFIRDELAPRSGCDCGALRQPDVLLKSCFPNLTDLYLWDILELEVLPEEFRDLSSLERLIIWDCPKLKKIPDWIDTLSSLQYLSIENAPEVKVLPDSIGSLTSLGVLKLSCCTGLELPPHQISESCYLLIWGCSKALYEKCVKPTSEYWPHLQHLQSLYIKSSEGDEFEYEREDFYEEDEISKDTSTALIIPQSSNDVATTPPLTLIGVPKYIQIYYFFRNSLFLLFVVVVVTLFVMYSV